MKNKREIIKNENVKHNKIIVLFLDNEDLLS